MVEFIENHAFESITLLLVVPVDNLVSLLQFLQTVAAVAVELWASLATFTDAPVKFLQFNILLLVCLVVDLFVLLLLISLLHLLINILHLFGQLYYFFLPLYVSGSQLPPFSLQLILFLLQLKQIHISHSLGQGIHLVLIRTCRLFPTDSLPRPLAIIPPFILIRIKHSLSQEVKVSLTESEHPKVPVTFRRPAQRPPHHITPQLNRPNKLIIGNILAILNNGDPVIIVMMVQYKLLLVITRQHKLPLIL